MEKKVRALTLSGRATATATEGGEAVVLQLWDVKGEEHAFAGIPHVMGQIANLLASAAEAADLRNAAGSTKTGHLPDRFQAGWTDTGLPALRFLFADRPPLDVVLTWEMTTDLLLLLQAALAKMPAPESPKPSS